MSDTPRTDALHFAYKDGISMQRHELLKLSRTLERELAAAIASIDEERERAQREGARVIKLQVELAEAQAEIVRECIAQVRKDENGPAYEAAGRIAQHFGIE